MKTNRIIAIHLLNDFSGSPFVLRQSIEALINNGFAVELFTATPAGTGFLSNIDGAVNHSIFYKWSANKLSTLCYFIAGQLSVFFKLLFFLKKNDIVYINSLLPFGAAIAAKIRGCKVVYHFHEVSIKPVLLKKILLFFANATADKGIFVSKFLQKNTPFTKPKQLVYNSLPTNFIAQAPIHSNPQHNPFTVLMVCSLKKYKGVEQFVALANRLLQYKFVLVLNATQQDVNAFASSQVLPENITLYPAQSTMHRFYDMADLVLNLSLPDQWVETFGMTILEAMYYRKPVIIPTVGGITELVIDGVEGYRVNAYNMDELVKKVQHVAENNTLYLILSANAFNKATRFTPQLFSTEIINVFTTLCKHSNPPIATQQPNPINTTQQPNYENKTISSNRLGRHTGQLRRI